MLQRCVVLQSMEVPGTRRSMPMNGRTIVTKLTVAFRLKLFRTKASSAVWTLRLITTFLAPRADSVRV
jgi:hypothetical protein